MTAAQTTGSAASASCVLEQDKDAVTILYMTLLTWTLEMFFFFGLSVMDSNAHLTLICVRTIYI